MTGDWKQHISAGDPLRFFAAAHNKLADIADAFDRARVQQNNAGTKQELPEGLLWIQNNSGATIGEFGVLGIDNVVVSPTKNLPEFKCNAALIGIVPSLPTHKGRFVITYGPVTPGASCLAFTFGVCAALVSISDTSHKWCEATSGITSYLTSGNVGSAQILVNPSGAAGLKWCLIRFGGRAGLDVGYDHCGTELDLYTDTINLDFNAEHFTLYQIAPATRGEVAVYWRGSDVKTLGYCQSGEANNVEIIEFVNTIMPSSGRTYPVCTNVTPTTAHRTNSACGPDSLAQAAAVSHTVTIPDAYVYLPPYVPPVTTPPTTAPPSASPPTIIYIIPSLLPGGGGSTDPPYLTTNGISRNDTLLTGMSVSGETITLTNVTYSFTLGLLMSATTGSTTVSC